FYLNGQKLFIRGLDRHQNFPYVGYAAPKHLQEEDARILKEELACNAVRTSHYPQSHWFINACDRLGLLVFTEIPGWQHIGGEAWQDIAVENVREMILQYRNHPSIFMWGVRINESQDDHEFYTRTNTLARQLDMSRPIGGVRYIKKSELLEDVYTFNDFIHDGVSPATSKKKNVTTDMSKGYLISEYNGHMYPTKAFDDEPHRTEHALRHARVLDSVALDDEIAGSFGWCMFDYNTHRDFGSGDRICYHGVTDMFRNPKVAAYVYRAQSDEGTVLEVSSSMDIGEYPGGLFKNIYIYSNADLVKVYRNGRQIALYCTSAAAREKLENSGEYKEISNYSSFKNLSHGPVYMNDFIGNRLTEDEGLSKRVANAVKKLLMDALENGMDHLSLSAKLTAARLMLFHGFKIEDGVRLYSKYVSGWGENANVFTFEAIKDGDVVKTVTKGATTKPRIEAAADHTVLVEETTYDAALVRITARDDYGNVLPYCQDPLKLETEGPIELVGPDMISFKGGMTGTIVKTTGEPGTGKLKITDNRGNEAVIRFDVRLG
ncbi:MAG: glycoside hydrolase family 2 protein, partial [Lachnospiraceae bacterium]|nr:glycoside hydrolase family 2 protein [Lachnospiraceae bacterium]